MGLVANSRDGVVIFVVAVRVPMFAFVEVIVVNVSTPPVKVMEGAEIAEENVVRFGEVVTVINCVLVLASVTDPEKSTPFNVNVVNDP